MSKTEKNQEVAAAKAGMDPKTAREYLRDPRLPSERKEDRKWRTRDDPFTEVWEGVREQIAANPGLEAKTLFEALQRKYPGQFADGQVRTLQRRLKRWRATEGPKREVFFTQQHVAGRLGQSDFTHMNDLNITIGAQSFPHMLFHFVLTFSNWEAVSLCCLKRERVKVDSGSLIYVDRNAYSVHSRLIGESVEARIAAETIEVWYAGNKVEELPRLRGRGKHRVDYRHIIDWLVRKPGAFENYRYREELFPTSRFRMAWDALRETAPVRANKRYLEILELAAKEGEARVDDILRCVLEQGEMGEGKLNAKVIAGILNEGAAVPAATNIDVDEVSLASFDELLGSGSKVTE